MDNALAKTPVVGGAINKDAQTEIVELQETVSMLRTR